ncbi:porin [Photobacterium sp. ZSDE20]|uniref:Porin n=1 Tax=Photobacterium pectinilyticum TaxID=2906793 RepID=A0ABT1N3G7_9GAMM|nr:porin [Photobacterium sp. ZSDE20]MCQ1059087.1 porin [Photobacterium sp. ZSDE20]MDD1824170.1 porin [Photobacterium sp. ZSDE20]
MDITAKRKVSLSLLSTAMLVSFSSHAVLIYEDENSQVELFGEVSLGAYMGNQKEYAEYNSNEALIDDTFGTLGVKGQTGNLIYRLELDFQRENWNGGTGEMVLDFDKAYMGYFIDSQHYIEIGMTDTAVDDIDGFGDLTFELGVEIPDAGDQPRTVKYHFNYNEFQAAASYSYKSESSSGSDYGDVVSGYAGYFGDRASLVLGLEKRAGSEGSSQYGEGYLYTLGARYLVNQELEFGINGFIQNQDIAQERTVITPPEGYKPGEYQFNQYETLKNSGLLVSARYAVLSNVDVFASSNYESREEWDKFGDYWTGNDTQWREWGKDRIWHTAGLSYRPTHNTEFGAEISLGETAQIGYASATVYF